MAKKPDSGNGKSKDNSRKNGRGVKSEAIRVYLKKNNRARPKEVVAALKKQGVEVSPNLVSIIRAKAGVKRARRTANQALADHDVKAGAKEDRAVALDAALTLYKAAEGRETRSASVRDAFLRLVSYIR
jgi:hypothetical protein